MTNPPLIACSRMYNVAPEVIEAWDAIFAHISVASGVPLEVIYHAFPQSIEELWSRPRLGCVLMCGYPYARATPRPTLLASPIPSPAHYDDKPVYFSHLLVAEDSPFQSIEDTFGHRISWTIENSQSGYNAVRSFLLPYRTPERPRLYSESIGPIGTFTVGIEGIRNNEIDVVPIDSFSYDLMARYVPDTVAGTRILATTPASPFPPLIAGHDVDPSVADALRSAILQLHHVPHLHEPLQLVMMKRFVGADSAQFETTLKQAAAAESAGYPVPA
ncbi:MAG: PhnD/SsuA/transferrin family substrate-binding protein [Chloroflexota bacterium]